MEFDNTEILNERVISSSTELHRTLLTYFREVHCVTEGELFEDFELMAQKLSPNVGDNKSALSIHINEINTNILPFGMKVSKMIDQVKGELNYVLINQRIDETAKSLSSYKLNELDVIKGIINDIARAKNFKYLISFQDCKRIASFRAKKTPDDSTMMIKKFIDDGWFKPNSAGNLVMSTQAICELQPYMVNTFGFLDRENPDGMLRCKFCKDIVTIGYKCSEKHCTTSFHSKCYNLHLRSHSLICSDHSEMHAIQVGEA